MRSALHLTLISQPIISSRIYKILSAVSKRGPGIDENSSEHDNDYNAIIMMIMMMLMMIMVMMIILDKIYV